jgi:hypothetical protein
MLTTRTYLPPWQLPSSETRYDVSCAGALYHYDLAVAARPQFVVRRTKSTAMCACGFRTEWFARLKGDPTSGFEEAVCSDGCMTWEAADWDMDEVDPDDEDWDFDCLE